MSLAQAKERPQTLEYTREQLYEITRRAMAAGDLRRAIPPCRQMNEIFEEYFEGWEIASELHLRLNKPQAGIIAIERALALRPGDTQASLQRIQCWLAMDQTARATEALRPLARRVYSNVDICNRLGLLLTQLNMNDEALRQYQRAVELEPDSALAYYNLAAAQRFAGELEAAQSSINRGLAMNPLDHEGQALRSSLRKQTPESNHVQELERLLEHPKLTEQGKIHICHALAKELDDLGDCEHSFPYLKQGNDLRRKHMAYQVETDLEIMATLRDAYQSAQFPAVSRGHESDAPIFVVGLPRTGTTLIERILGSHSTVFPAGELNTFASEMLKLMPPSAKGKRLARKELIEASVNIDFRALGSHYVSTVKPLTAGAERFVDKLPFNFLYLGLIHLALPNARIINLVRHPMAACYAIYKQLFRDAYPFSYDLQDLGRYYVAYHQLMAHWNQLMPGRIYNLAYEDMVADTENQTRRLLQHCGLPFEEQCLRFYENKQASTTASASQVRQPIYTSSLDKWRPYHSQLQPLADILTAAGIDIE